MMTALAIRAYRYALSGVAIVLLVSIFAGCASFREITAFASLSSSAAANNAVVKDYIGSIDRRKQYEPEKFHRELDAQKARREAQRASLDMLQQSVTAYMQALAGLTSGNARSNDESLEEFSERLNQVALLSDTEKDAAYALSTLLSRTVTSVYREHEVKKLIRDANQPLQEVLAATGRITGMDIVADLRGERALVERYYDNFMLAPGNPDEPVAMALAREARVRALDRVDSKIQATQSYQIVLGKVARGHQYLYEHVDRIGDHELDRHFQPYVDELEAAYREFVEVAM
ncbi:MAG TPA: hypothetical protein VFI43_00870 [Nitrosospira sp.]|nr:hypothetical protein [Nitrosospira sp.]